MKETTNLKPCPFCGNKVSISICDDKGNEHSDTYKQDPWDGLSFKIRHVHKNSAVCPIANIETSIQLYDSEEEAIEIWNRRI